MKQLGITLKVKMWLTALLWCAPLLVFPSSIYELLGFVELGPLVFIRLLGVAYLSLLAGYYLGYKDLVAGIYPSNTVIVGLISNFGAFVMLLGFGVLGSWSHWGLMAKCYMWLSLLATGSISLSLYVYGPKSHGFGNGKMI